MKLIPHLVASLDRATFSNIENQSISFIDNTIVPWVSRIEQSINKSLFTANEMKKYFVKFNLNARLRGYAASRANFYQIMRRLLGFLYYKFIGCSSGSCPITSNPMNSTLYGAVMGMLIYIIMYRNYSNIKKEISLHK